MNVAIDHCGRLDIKLPVSEKGKYIILEAHVDLILVMSSCPQDLAPVNSGMPTDCEYEILSGTCLTHIMGMAERVVTWLKSWGDDVEFCRHEDIARLWFAEHS